MRGVFRSRGCRVVGVLQCTPVLLNDHPPDRYNSHVTLTSTSPFLPFRFLKMSNIRYQQTGGKRSSVYLASHSDIHNSFWRRKWWRKHRICVLFLAASRNVLICRGCLVELERPVNVFSLQIDGIPTQATPVAPTNHTGTSCFALVDKITVNLPALE